jgi:hypothetical protein
VFERYTEEARRALFFARFETSQRGGTSIESEYLLLGVIRENGGLVNAILTHFRVTPLTLLREIDAKHLFLALLTEDQSVAALICVLLQPKLRDTGFGSVRL